MPDGATILAPPRAVRAGATTRPARPPVVTDFAAKLGRLLDALNWSRAELARRAGVDKSVALRWAAGSVVPGESSLVALTTAIREVLPGFARADWRLPEAEFAARLRPPPPATATPAFPFPRAAGADAASAARYGGTWLLLHASVQSRDRLAVVGHLASVAPRDGIAWMRASGSVQGTRRAEGPICPMHRLLHVVLEEAGESMAFCVLWGSIAGKAMVLDGIASSAASSRRGPAVATRMIGLRLGDDPDPHWFGAALLRLARLNAQDLAARLPPGLAARFVQSAPLGKRPMVMAVPAEATLACDAEEIAAGLAPDGAVAIAAARRLLELG